MGLWLVLCEIQLLSLTSSQSCSTPSFNRPLCSALHSKSNTLVLGSSSPPQDHPKYSLPSHATSQLFFQQVRKRRRRKWGSMARQNRAAGMLHQHAEPRATSTVAGQRLAHPDKLLWGKMEIQPQK